MVNLFVSFYCDPAKERQQELEQCLLNNINNPAIDKIYLLVEDSTVNKFDSTKVKSILIDSRPMFQTFFDTVNLTTASDDLNIIINTDIYFDASSVSAAKKHIANNQCYALTRWDILPDGSAKFLARRDSQDAWIFKGKINYKDAFVQFMQGKPGCDNRLAHELNRVGYRVLNPSIDIKSYHIHNTQIKSYVRDENHIVPGPYMRLDPTAL